MHGVTQRENLICLRLLHDLNAKVTEKSVPNKIQNIGLLSSAQDETW